MSSRKRIVPHGRGHLKKRLTMRHRGGRVTGLNGSIQKGSLLILATFLILAFQNCSNGANFESGEIIAKADDSGGSGDTGTDDGGGNIGNPGTPGNPGNGGGGGSEDDCDDHDHNGGGHGGGHDGNHGGGSSSNNALKYLCVVRDSNGSSAKIAITDTSGSSREVCMTENACEKILNTQFDVRKAEKSSSCPADNKKKVSLTDSEIQAALAKADLLKAMKQK